MLDRKIEGLCSVLGLKELGYPHALPIDGQHKSFTEPRFVVYYQQLVHCYTSKRVLNADASALYRTCADV